MFVRHFNSKIFMRKMKTDKEKDNKIDLKSSRTLELLCQKSLIFIFERKKNIFIFEKVEKF